MLKEIEIKFFVGARIEEMLSKIKELGWALIDEEFQEDIYYTSKHKDFIKSEECLRIRQTNKNCEITWKPPTTKDMLVEKQFWKQEVDLNIDGQKEVATILLQNLDFIEYVTVTKRRMTFSIDSASNISLDHIETLGWFLEIETFSDIEQDGILKNQKIALTLNIDLMSAVNIPYRDLVKEGKIYSR